MSYDDGDLLIHEARYGWAGNLWEGSADPSGDRGRGIKDVTSTVRIDVTNNELHLNPDCRGQYFNQHFCFC